MAFQFDPPDGIRNTSIYPSNPASEAAAREQIQGLLDQIKEYINDIETVENPIAPTLINSWTNYGSGIMSAGYWKDFFNVVWLRGTVKDGTINQPIFTLPVGYRPTGNLAFICNSANGLCTVTVDTNGNVKPLNGSNTDISLDNIQFRVGV